MAVVEARASAEGSLWGPVEELGADGLTWAPGSNDALPGGCPTEQGDSRSARNLQGAAEELGDISRADVDEESSSPETVRGETQERQAELDALFEPENPVAAVVSSDKTASLKQSQAGDAWEDDVEPFVLDDDFDYDAVKLTPKHDLEAEKRAWLAAQQQKKQAQ